MVTITAKIKVKSGTEDSAKELLASLLEPSRKDKGCVSYDMHTHSGDPTLFMFYERWESQADLDVHIQSGHVRKVFEKLEFAREPQIENWEIEGSQYLP